MVAIYCKCKTMGAIIWEHKLLSCNYWLLKMKSRHIHLWVALLLLLDIKTLSYWSLFFPWEWYFRQINKLKSIKIALHIILIIQKPHLFVLKSCMACHLYSVIMMKTMNLILPGLTCTKWAHVKQYFWVWVRADSPFALM